MSIPAAAWHDLRRLVAVLRVVSRLNIEGVALNVYRFTVGCIPEEAARGFPHQIVSPSLGSV
jgi:hypothetical protein